MITFEDARQVVHNSVGKMASRSRFDPDDTLSDLGIQSQTDLHYLIQTIVLDPDVGAISLSAKVEPDHFSALALTTTVRTLVDALQLSARKLCSNSTSPHEQPCCPYPKICGDCGSPVL
jgi:hypothetical protein